MWDRESRNGDREGRNTHRAEHPTEEGKCACDGQRGSDGQEALVAALGGLTPRFDALQRPVREVAGQGAPWRGGAVQSCQSSVRGGRSHGSKV